jgi:hypothetical protein
MYLGHHMADMTSNPTSNESPLHFPPALEGEWEKAQQPDIPPPILYPQVNVEARYLIG